MYSCIIMSSTMLFVTKTVFIYIYSMTIPGIINSDVTGGHLYNFMDLYTNTSSRQY